eukprot:CCRYP_006352-RC/>CCRYP_006352-RC protein AED:0.38 eAED:1.00 QI:0/-1/0/1/-1/0/1/0/34
MPYWTHGRHKFVCHPCQEGYHHAKRYALGESKGI